ncbi:hypothetical protein AVEN_169228-1 [Araneus ventricosus]|uniref:Uncharacterized protein n=1 Tax=Araneus ventricosus TaxID=182803 RepID=A0A4Y2QNR3_ARAVE|nr:hypothetical protein AVEN_169228-1 [Araneus ventricosus]
MIIDLDPQHMYVPDSNFGLQQSCSNLALQICKLAARLTRQECKLETSLQHVNASFEVNTLQICHKLFTAKYSRNRVRTQLRIRNSDLPLPKPDALTNRPARL